MTAKKKMYIYAFLSVLSLLAVIYLCIHWTLFIAIGQMEGETIDEAKKSATFAVLFVGFLPALAGIIFGKLALSNRKKIK